MKKVLIQAFAMMMILSCAKTNEHKTQHYEVTNPNEAVEWKGYLLDGYFNKGTFSVSSSNLKTKDGKLTGGSFTIPIASLGVVNLDGPPKDQLENHLKSADFFNLVIHPTATFNIISVAPYLVPVPNAVTGANVLVTGSFTLLGVTKTISFPARVANTGDGLQAEALFTINRVDYGMTYASDPALGEHHILPTVDIHLSLQAARQ